MSGRMTATLWMHAHRRSLLFLCLILALGGIMAALRLPVSLFPDVSFPRVRVTCVARTDTTCAAAAAAKTIVKVISERIRRVIAPNNTSG